MEPTLEVIHQNPKLLPEQVSEQIKKLIQSNKWEAGDKLPNEFEMAKQLSVGRGTIREAVKLLVAQNILEIRRGRGTFVCENTGVASDPLGLSFVHDKEQLALDMCEVRLIIEPQIAAKAAERAGSEDIKELKKLCKAVEEQILAGKNHTQEDIVFHEALAACTGNQVIKQLIPLIQSSIMLFVDITKAGLKENTIEEHNQLVEPVEAHDVKKAEEIMISHIKRNQSNIQAMIEEKKEGM